MRGIELILIKAVVDMRAQDAIGLGLDLSAQVCWDVHFASRSLMN